MKPKISPTERGMPRTWVTRTHNWMSFPLGIRGGNGRVMAIARRGAWRGVFGVGVEGGVTIGRNCFSGFCVFRISEQLC